MELKKKIHYLIKNNLCEEDIKRHKTYIDYMLHNGYCSIIYYLENKNDFF